MTNRAAIVALVPFLIAGVAQAQRPITVQQPVQSTFSIGTTVSIPDSGAGMLGGVRGSSQGATGRTIGVPGVRGLGNRGGGRNDIGRGAQVTAQIHDLDELDRQLLSSAAKPATSKLPWAASSVLLQGPTASLAEIRRNQAARRATTSDEASALIARGQQAAEAGKLSLAQAYYRMAADKAQGDQRSAALAKLNQLSAHAKKTQK